MYHVFVDFKAAFDSVLRIKLYSAMTELQIPKKLIDLTKLIMSRVLCAVKIQNDMFETFETKVGLRQGDALVRFLTSRSRK